MPLPMFTITMGMVVSNELDALEIVRTSKGLLPTLPAREHYKRLIRIRDYLCMRLEREMLCI